MTIPGSIYTELNYNTFYPHTKSPVVYGGLYNFFVEICSAHRPSHFLLTFILYHNIRNIQGIPI